MFTPRRAKLSLIAAGAMAAIISVGSATTAGNTLPAPTAVVGYGAQTISGVTVETITYNLNTAKDTINSVGLKVLGNTATKTIQIAFNDATPANCSGAGVFDLVTNTTTYTCVVNGGLSVALADKFAVVAS